MHFVFFFLLVLFSFSGFAQDSLLVRQQKVRKSSIAGIALPSRTPENGFYVQGGIINMFKTDYTDSTLRASNLYLFGFYSQLHQFRLSIGGEVFTPQEKFYIYSWIYYSYSPEQFFGVGRAVDPERSEFISYRVFYSQIDVLKKVKGKWFAGINTRLETPYAFEYDKGGLFESTYRNQNDFEVYGGGLRLRFDNRDNVLSSRTGSFIDLSVNAYNFWSKRQFQFSTYNLDVRKFFWVSKKRRQVWALQGIAEFIEGKAPFRYLSDITTRAYHPNLYKDNVLFLARNEFRFAVYKFIGLSVFSGLGVIAPNLTAVDLNQTKWNVGAGLRLLVSPKYNMNLRADYGIGERSSNYYISFTDAF